MKTTWIHLGSPVEHTTPRLPGESDSAWATRHLGQVHAIWTDPTTPIPPDIGTSVTTTWTSGGQGIRVPVSTHDPSAGLRGWMELHLEALIAALELAPAD